MRQGTGMTDRIPLRRVVRGSLVAGWLVGAVACGGSSADPLPKATSLTIATGADGQTAAAGAKLPAPLAVTTLASDAAAVPRTPVRWTVVAGSGATLSDTVSVSDGNGRAEVVLTLGSTAGTYQVKAALADDPSVAVTFTATATPGPQLTSVTPTSFSGGDTLELTGTALGAAAAVEVGGAPAVVVSGTATTLRVTAPVCLPPGPVEIRAQVAGARSNALTGTYTSSLGPLTLAVGEFASIGPAQLAGCATFPAAGADTVEYLFAPQSAAALPGLNAQYRLRGDSVVVVVAADDEPARTPLPWATRFHDELRRQEAAAAKLPREPLDPALAAAAATTTVEVGDRRSFQVCNTIPCSSTSNFATVTATAKYVGEHAAIFQDDAAPGGGFTTEDFTQIGALFDSDLYDVATGAFGAESDVDRNGVTIILFSPQVNELTPETQCGTSIITGYFFGIDIDPLFLGDSRSNRGEVFYAIAPDPDGAASCPLSTEVVRRLVPVTFIHEFQHMISYYQHALLRAGDSEVLWLNEGLSHISEELAALHFEAQGRDSLFSRFAIGDLYNAYLYLEQPGGVYVLPGAGTGSLEERGAAWLFLRWLLDQYGSATTRLLVETSRTGADNVATAVGESFDKLITRWFLANWVADLPGFSPPAPLTYTTWRFRTTYQGLHDQLPARFPEPYPLVPPLFDAGTFEFNGIMRSGSGDYLRIRQAPGTKGFTLLMTDWSGNPLPAAVVPRLNMIRIR